MFNGITTLMPVLVKQPGGNTAGELLRAAESVLSQECGIPQELLIIDDGSPYPLESIPELKPLFARSGARLLRLVENRGLEYALNAGIAQARYDMIARVDCDDFWRPGKLAKQLQAFEADPTVTLVATSMRLIHPHQPELDRDDVRGGGWHEILRFFKRVGCPFPHGSILARKSVFNLLGGYPHDALLTFCEDFALWASWVRFFNVQVLEDVLFEYTISETQVTKQHEERARRASGIVHQTFLDLGDHQTIPGAVSRIAERLSLPLLQASAVLCTAWRFYTDILADEDLYEACRIVFPDRSVYLYHDAVNQLADRFFYLHRGPCEERPIRHARCTHTVDRLLSLIPSL